MLMSIRELIISYLKEMEKLIKKHTGESWDCRDIFLWEDDLAEIREWELSYCIVVLERFVAEEDIRNFPWCLLYRKEGGCRHDCKYGVRHGVCTQSNSTYNRIIRCTNLKGINNSAHLKNVSAVVNIPGVLELARNFKRRGNQMLDLIDSIRFDRKGRLYFIAREGKND